jgi:hypothetical protein
MRETALKIPVVANQPKADCKIARRTEFMIGTGSAKTVEVRHRCKIFGAVMKIKD